MTFADVINKLIGFINLSIPVLIALELVFLMLSGVRYIMSAGEGGREQRNTMLWGIVAIFVTVSIWGIIRVMCLSVFGNVSCH